MSRVSRTVRRFHPENYPVSWLAVGQLLSLIISTTTFAVLARTLGPTPFAAFALLIFAYTLICLMLDLSPQGFLLVNHGTRSATAVALKLTAISASLTAILVFSVSALLIDTAPVMSRADPFVIAALLATAAVSQLAGQVPRARLILSRRYGSAAIADVTASAVSGASAIMLSLSVPNVTALAFQLSALAIVRLIVSWLLSITAVVALDVDVPERTNGLLAALRYGLSVMPLNIASYLSRSIDSGVLPLFAPASAAAGYARSYQLVVTPITQLQLSFGGAVIAMLSKNRNDDQAFDRSLSFLWRVIIGGVAIAAISISALAVPAEFVFFGSEWPMAAVFVAGMSAALPGAAIATYFSWWLQVFPSVRRSLIHLCLIVLNPLLVVSVLVGSGSVQAALVALLIGSLASPLAMIFRWQSMLPKALRVRTAIAATCVIWGIVAVIFLTTATIRGFWGFSAW